MEFWGVCHAVLSSHVHPITIETSDVSHHRNERCSSSHHGNKAFWNHTKSNSFISQKFMTAVLYIIFKFLLVGISSSHEASIQFPLSKVQLSTIMRGLYWLGAIIYQPKFKIHYFKTFKTFQDYLKIFNKDLGVQITRECRESNQLNG